MHKAICDRLFLMILVTVFYEFTQCVECVKMYGKSEKVFMSKC